VAGGSIAQMLEKFGPFTEDVAAIYTSRVVTGLAYLHDHKVVHGDIKGANILIDTDGEAKLADFGSSSLIEDIVKSETISLRGTTHWMAPEVLYQRDVGPFSDIWSLGCLVMEMMTGKIPWAHMSKRNIGDIVSFVCDESQKIVLPNEWSEDLQHFVESCLQRDPTCRPTAKQLLNQRWLQGATSGESKKVTQKLAELVSIMKTHGPLSEKQQCEVNQIVLGLAGSQEDPNAMQISHDECNH